MRGNGVWIAWSLTVANGLGSAACDEPLPSEPLPQAPSSAALPLPSAALPPEAPRQGPHGELPPEEQKAALGERFDWRPDGGLPSRVDEAAYRAKIPPDNAASPERIALGRDLFFDARLSRDGTVACATCHDVSRGFADQRNASEGIDGQVGRRNSPTVLNAVYFQTFFLDGRAASLEEQAKLPFVNPIEMGQPDGAAVVKVIESIPEYRDAFQKAYGRAINYDDVGRALAAFQRTLVFLDAPFDRYVAGDVNAISREARAGWVLFNGKGRCVSCHRINSQSPIGTDDKFHNVGVSARHEDFAGLASKALAALALDSSQATIDRLALQTDVAELGRFVVTRNRADMGGFKTLQLRNVGVTAPYMHDGSLATLWDVMDHYNKGGEDNPFLDGGIEALDLTNEEIDQMVAFLFSLTDRRFAADNERAHAAQIASAGQKRPFRDVAVATRKVIGFEKRATGAEQGAEP